MKNEKHTLAKLQLQRRDFIFRAIRSFFYEAGFIEVDPPILVPGTGCEPHIDPLSIEVKLGEGQRALQRYLHTSPELYLKRLLARVPEPSFFLGHVFRDGERTAKHLPEFTMLEWYRPHAKLEELILDCEEWVSDVLEKCEEKKLDANSDSVRLLKTTPYDVISMCELWQKHARIDLKQTLAHVEEKGEQVLVDVVKKAGFSLRPQADFDDAFFQVMMTAIEPQIGQQIPTVVTQWPKQMAVLSKLDETEPLFARRFELYAGGFELANAFDELTDGEEQRGRFIRDNEKRVSLGKGPLRLDEAFLSELEQMPPTAGIAFGLDRLFQLLFGLQDIAAAYPLAGKMEIKSL